MKQLLFSVTKKDFDIQTFRSGKKGGQNRDKNSTAVRIIHRDSGAVGKSQDQRSREQNKKIAFHRLLETKEWKNWHRIETARHLGAYVETEEKLRRWMDPKNFKIEVKKDGKWVEISAVDGNW